MHKQQLYADMTHIVSAGILAIPRTDAAPKFFFSALIDGYDFNVEDDAMPTGVREQTEIALKKIDAALAQAGGGPSNVARLTVFVKDSPTIDALTITVTITEAIQAFFCFERPGNVTLPAQSVIFVSRLPYDHLGQLIGIEATAIID